MGNLIIKGKGGAGNKLILQDQAGAAVLTTADSGATIASGVTGGAGLSGMTSLGTVTAGNLSNSAIVYPAGHVLQVVQGPIYSASLLNTSATYATTDLDVTITPSSTSNKILVMLSQTYDTQAGARAIEWALYRDGSTIQDKIGYSYVRGDSSNARSIATFSYNYLHSPSTTSSTTYQLYARSVLGNQVYVRYSGTASAIIAMEIQG
jgi:hypothetical protein